MIKFYTKILNKLETAIHELEIETNCPIQKTETIIKLIVQSHFCPLLSKIKSESA